MVDCYAYLFLGDDANEKEKKINDIKTNYLDKGLKTIDFEAVYSDDKELTPPKFHELLSYFPANLSKKRVVFIKKLKSLSQENRDILIRYLKKPSKYQMLALDAEGLAQDDSFVKQLLPLVRKISFKEERRFDTFDLWRAISVGNADGAMKILTTLLNNRQRPENILGSLVWQWEGMRDRMSLAKFKQGFKLLLNADLSIKTAKLSSEIALELLIVRLSCLI